MQELSKQIEDYIATYQPKDELEWTLVLGEIKSFIEVSCLCLLKMLKKNKTKSRDCCVVLCCFQADHKVAVIDVDGSPIVLNHRLTPLNTPTLEKTSPTHLSLQEILIVGNSNEQVRV